MRALYPIEHFFELYLHDADRVPALANALLNLQLLAVVFLVMGCHVEVGELVAELLLGLHHWFKFDEDGRRHVEEIVLSVQLLILIPQFSAPLT